MIKLAAKTFDVYDDADMTIARKLVSTLGTTKVAERDEVEALADNQFGLVLKTAGGVIRRRYPIHDADATKLSRAYAEETAVSLPEDVRVQVSVKLAAAEQHYGLVDHKLDNDFVTNVLDKVAYVDAEVLKPDRKKVAHETQTWGLVIDGKNYFPLHDSTLVKQADERFPFTASDLEPAERFEYARAIVKQASVLGVDIDRRSPVHNYTNDEVNVDSLKVALDERKRIMKAAGLGTEIVDHLLLAAGGLPDRGDIEKDASWNQKIARLAAIERLPADRVVSILQGIDKLAGLSSHHYNRGLPDPFASCFKRADALSPTMIDGVDLAKIQQHRLASTFDEDFVNEFSKNPTQVYSSLPAPVKAMVRSLAEEGMQAEPAGATQQPAPRVMAGGEPSDRLAPVYTNGYGSNSF